MAGMAFTNMARRRDDGIGRAAASERSAKTARDSRKAADGTWDPCIAISACSCRLRPCSRARRGVAGRGDGGDRECRPGRERGAVGSGEEEDAEQQRACQQASASGEGVDASEFLGGRFGGLIEAIDGQEVDFARRQVTAMKIEVAAHQRRKLVRRNSLTGSLAGRGPRRLVSRTVH